MTLYHPNSEDAENANPEIGNCNISFIQTLHMTRCLFFLQIITNHDFSWNSNIPAHAFV
jgi:hypothetical protein